MVKSSKITLQQMKSFLRMFFLKRLSDLFEEAHEKAVEHYLFSGNSKEDEKRLLLDKKI